MNTVECIVCGKKIGRLGWPSHVAKEKRKYGPSVYRELRKEKDKLDREQRDKLKAKVKNITVKGRPTKLEEFV